MNINKKILFLVLSLSLHGASKCMETDATLHQSILASIDTKKNHNIVSQRYIITSAKAIYDEEAIAVLEEQEKKRQEEREIINAKPAWRIVNFARPTQHNPEYLKLLAQWLTEQRNAITEIDEWNSVIEQIGSPITCGCYSQPNERTKKVHSVVVKIASELKPNQDCAELLIAESNKAIEDYNKYIFYSCPLLGNGLGADWYIASPECCCIAKK